MDSIDPVRVALACAALLVSIACGDDAERGPNDNTGGSNAGGSSAAGGSGGGGGTAGASTSTSGGAGGLGAGGNGGEPVAGGGTGGTQEESFPPSQQLDRGLVEYLGNVEDPKLPNASSGASLWTNLYRVDQSRALLETALFFEVQSSFTAHFAVYESDAREGSYTLIYQGDPFLMDPSMGLYRLYHSIEGVTLEAGKFYAIGAMVGSPGSGMVHALAAFSEGHAPRRVSFGEQLGATNTPITDAAGPPDVIMVTDAESAGRRFAASVLTN